MLDLKKLLMKILQNLHTIPYCHMRGVSTTNTAVTTNSWYYMNHFGGASTSHYLTDDTYFQSHTNGIVIKKNGTYKVSVNAYFTAAAANTGFAVSMYNYTTSTGIGDTRYVYAPAGVAWGCVVNDYVVDITTAQNTPNLIVPRFQRQSGSANIRPSSVLFSVMLLRDI